MDELDFSSAADDRYPPAAVQTAPNLGTDVPPEKRKKYNCRISSYRVWGRAGEWWKHHRSHLYPKERGVR